MVSPITFCGWRRLLPWILAGCFVVAGAFVFDKAVERWELQPNAPFYDFANACSRSGTGLFVILGGFGLSMLCLVFRRFDASRLVLVVILAGLLSGATSDIVRGFSGRTRPGVNAPQGFYGPHDGKRWLVGRRDFNSFPSGHSSTVGGMAAAALLIQWRLGLFVALYALAVAWSRLALGCHHFSDVVGGLTWGCFAGYWAVGVLEPWLAARWSKWLGKLPPFASSPTG